MYLYNYISFYLSLSSTFLQNQHLLHFILWEKRILFSYSWDKNEKKKNAKTKNYWWKQRLILARIIGCTSAHRMTFDSALGFLSIFFYVSFCCCYLSVTFNPVFMFNATASCWYRKWTMNIFLFLWFEINYMVFLTFVRKLSHFCVFQWIQSAIKCVIRLSAHCTI